MTDVLERHEKRGEFGKVKPGPFPNELELDEGREGGREERLGSRMAPEFLIEQVEGNPEREQLCFRHVEACNGPASPCLPCAP